MENDIIEKQLNIKNIKHKVKIINYNTNHEPQQAQLFHIDNNIIVEKKRKCIIFNDDIIIKN